MNRLSVTAFAATLACATPAAAEDWAYSATLYGWVPSLDAKVETPLGTVGVEPDGSDILDALDGAFMGVFTARKGRWGFTADIDYAALSSDESPPVGLVFNNVDVQTDISMINVKALYRVAETPKGFVNLTGGLRWYDLSLKTEFQSTAVANQKITRSDNWTDLTLGVSGYADLSERWFLAGFVDVGGFGIGDSSELSWQAFGALGYRFNEKWSAELGYRYLSIEQEIDNFDVTLDMYGPVIGVTARF